MDFEFLILGSDINAYYMARCYHEEYNKKAYMIGKTLMNFTSYSKIINFELCNELQDSIQFKKVLKNFYNKHKDKKILLIGSNDNYVRLIIENKEYLEKYFVFPNFSIDLLNTFLIKENFYTKFKGVDIPKTYIYNVNDSLDKKEIKGIGFPLIIKPSDGIIYHQHEFTNQFKVYKATDYEQLNCIIKDIKNSGYDSNLIIQKFIKGDDSYLFDCVAYVDRNSKVKLMSFAQIGLQEHTKTGIGNATVVVNGYNKFNNTEKIVEKLKKSIENIGYNGFLEFDLKYDTDDKKFKVLEINPRQARCSYYLCFAGYNLVKYLVEDLIYNKDINYHFIDNKIALSFVPKGLIKKYVIDKDLKKQILDLYKSKKVVNPLKYKKDNMFKRKCWLILRGINYYKKYKNSDW